MLAGSLYIPENILKTCYNRCVFVEYFDRRLNNKNDCFHIEISILFIYISSLVTCSTL